MPMITMKKDKKTGKPIIRILMTYHNWTSKDVAKKMHCSTSLIEKIISGYRHITDDRQMQFCEIFNTDLGDLFTCIKTNIK